MCAVGYTNNSKPNGIVTPQNPPSLSIRENDQRYSIRSSEYIMNLQSNGARYYIVIGPAEVIASVQDRNKTIPIEKLTVFNCQIRHESLIRRIDRSRQRY